MTDFTTMTQDIKDLKDSNTKILVAIAELPQKLFDKADERYACKETEKEVNSLWVTLNKRTYDWLKTSVMIILTIILTLLFGKYTHIGL